MKSAAEIFKKLKSLLKWNIWFLFKPNDVLALEEFYEKNYYYFNSEKTLPDLILGSLLDLIATRKPDFRSNNLFAKLETFLGIFPSLKKSMQLVPHISHYDDKYLCILYEQYTVIYHLLQFISPLEEPLQIYMVLF